MDVPTFRRVLRILLRRYRPGNWAEGRDPFDVLMSIVVSQNSTDLVTERVMADLRSRTRTDAQSIAGMDPDRLVDVLRPAGLARQKVPKIQAAARAIVEGYGGSMDGFLRAREDRAQEMLLALPGVGPKTADVWLSLVAGRDTMPMDTHIARLVRRWRLSKAKGYAGINEDLRRYVPRGLRQRGHLALIDFGREVCQARRPRCDVCPVYTLCDATEKRPRHGSSKA